MALNCIPKLPVHFCNFFLDPTYFFVKRAVISKWLSYWITGGHLYCTKTWSGPVPLLGRLLGLSVNFSDKISSTAVLSVPLLGSWWAKYVGFLVFRIGASYKEKYFLLTRGGAKRFETFSFVTFFQEVIWGCYQLKFALISIDLRP